MSTIELQHKIRACLTNMPEGHNVRKISLFGSHLHGNTTTDSDIDLLVEFREPVGYFALARMQEQFEQTLGQPVDLVTPKSLSKYFREKVLSEAQSLYEQ